MRGQVDARAGDRIARAGAAPAQLDDASTVAAVEPPPPGTASPPELPGATSRIAARSRRAARCWAPERLAQPALEGAALAPRRGRRTRSSRDGEDVQIRFDLPAMASAAASTMWPAVAGHPSADDRATYDRTVVPRRRALKPRGCIASSPAATRVTTSTPARLYGVMQVADRRRRAAPAAPQSAPDDRAARPARQSVIDRLFADHRRQPAGSCSPPLGADKGPPDPPHGWAGGDDSILTAAPTDLDCIAINHVETRGRDRIRGARPARAAPVQSSRPAHAAGRSPVPVRQI